MAQGSMGKKDEAAQSLGDDNFFTQKLGVQVIVFFCWLWERGYTRIFETKYLKHFYLSILIILIHVLQLKSQGVLLFEWWDLACR